VQIVCSKIAQNLLRQFGVEHSNMLVVKEGDVLDLGGLTLRFIAAPMIHWPEVMMSYCEEEKVLFSADAFGKFGVYKADADDWACEARRYYFNIVGKYGVQVQAVLKKIAGLAIESIAPLHGPVLESEKRDEALRLYGIWSAYGVETEGVFVVSASIHGNTLKAAEFIADELRKKGLKVAFSDITRDDMAEAVEDAFRYGKIVLCASTYDADLFPPMHTFLHKLQLKGYRDRRVALVENGSWAPAAAKVMRGMVEAMKNVEIVEPVVTLRGAMKEADKPALIALAEAIC
jgi:flavorubredoxin